MYSIIGNSVAVFLALVLSQGNCAVERNASPNYCVCSQNYQPVCGSDQVTYSNQCDLSCSQKFNPGVHAACNGPCPCKPQGSGVRLPLPFSYSYVNNDEDKDQACYCPRIWKPVCGSNSVTYSNDCMLECAQRRNSSLVKVHDEPC